MQLLDSYEEKYDEKSNKENYTFKVCIDDKLSSVSNYLAQANEEIIDKAFIMTNGKLLRDIE